MPVQYQKKGILADGGMAEICLARAADDQTLVALKRIKRPYDRDPSFVAMFEDEARLWSQLRHPNIVRLLDSGSDDEGPFIAMELVEGLDIAQVLGTGSQPLPMAFCLEVAASLCDALEYLHTWQDQEGTPRPLIHRDVSPGNILCDCCGKVKLTDFGVVQAEIKTHQTRVGDLKGKFAYMSPEQTRGEELTAASDIFSAGIVLWEMLAGRPLFDEATDIDTAQAVRQAVIPPLAEIRDDVDPQLESLLHSMLAVDPEQRPQSADRVAVKLRAIARSTFLLLGTAPVLEVLQPLQEKAGCAEDRAVPDCRRRTLVAPEPSAGSGSQVKMLGLGALILVAVVATALFALNGRSQTTRSRTQTTGKQPLSGKTAPLVPIDAGKQQQEPLDASPSVDVAAATIDAGQPTTPGRRDATPRLKPHPKRDRRVPVKNRDGGTPGQKRPATNNGYGTLFLGSDPWAEVAINGVAIGRNTPLRDFSIVAGRHRITLHNPVFKITKTIVVEIQPGEKMRRVVDLTSD